MIKLRTKKDFDKLGDHFVACLKTCAPDANVSHMMQHYDTESLAIMAVAFGRYIRYMSRGGAEDMMKFASWVYSNDCEQMLVELFHDRV